MAIALIGSASASLSGGGASGSTFLVAGSGTLLVAVYAVASTADRALTISSASGGTWNLVGSELYANDTYDTNLRAAWKFADATGQDNTINYSSDAVSGDAGAALVFAFSGVSQSSPLDVTPVTASGTNGGQPDPGAITPATAGSSVLVIGAAALNSVSDLVPTGLSDTISRQGPASTNRIVVAGGTSAWTSGALDPAAWTGGGGASASASWAAVTLALRPALTGDLTKSLAGVTIGAAASLAISASLAAALASVTVSAAGELLAYNEGSSDIALSGASVAFTAVNPITGALAQTLGGVALLASDGTILTGEVGAVLSGVSISANGATVIFADAALTISGASLGAGANNGLPITTPTDRTITFSANRAADRTITFT